MIDQKCDAVYNTLINHRLFFIDTETTGLIKKKKMPQIVQIAVLDGETDEYFSSFVNPGIGKFIEPEAQKVNKISQSDIETAPMFPEIFQQLKDFIKKTNKIPILVAYNGKKFDFPLILHHMNQHQIKMEEDWKFCDFYLHVKKQVQPSYFEQLKGSKSQASLYYYLFNCQIPNHHQALGDVQALKQICLRAQQDNYCIKNLNQLQLHIFDLQDIIDTLDEINKKNKEYKPFYNNAYNYQENNYQENNYQENNYQENNYQDNNYQENNYLENNYQENNYQENNYQSQDYQDHQQDSFNQQFKKLSIQSKSFNLPIFSYKKEELKLQRRIQDYKI